MRLTAFAVKCEYLGAGDPNRHGNVFRAKVRYRPSIALWTKLIYLRICRQLVPLPRDERPTILRQNSHPHVRRHLYLGLRLWNIATENLTR